MGNSLIKSALRWQARLCIGLFAMCSGGAFAQTTAFDLGKREFSANCVNCHGANGKGGGPFVEFLRRSPPDLTTLSKRNSGVFPVTRVFETIEGANVPGHGSRDMPIWGTDYKIKAAEYYEATEYNPEAYVRTRILALVEYINRLQQ